MSPPADPCSSSSEARGRCFGAVAVLFAGLLLGACAGGPKLGDAMELAQAKTTETTGSTGSTGSTAVAQTELEKAIEYWGKQHTASPRDLKAALSYARNLKAAGRKDHALAVVQAASIYHGTDRELASEYGRLALDMGQTALAQRLLEAADDPAKPDWRVISARGTALAKQNQYKQAIPLYEQALRLSSEHPSVLSNLAMAHAAGGDVQRAEGMLRQAAEKPDPDPKVRQNLALVLGLQGKYDEARRISARDIPPENAAANVDYVRQMVRLAPQGAAVVVPSDSRPAASQIATAKRPVPGETPQLRGGTVETDGSRPAGGWTTVVADANAGHAKPR